ncbi:cupin domain-containing protein [Rubellimicrobium sp. CFH 75288]|uniref:cupin domain-containing protein n=1 Tax=Rubellimicrobium sp. CFH 75288 TaxID=2697034 RepID=UPI0014130476|nr:cupin domain-containing protein [Rubellimicrobium sp. CFH 75288]NAZ37612.1 DUF861 domain-containing protein [Rubellimicrobium sp. CFH 75288]
MAELFHFLSRNAAAPETSRPPRDRVIAGDPVFTTWNSEEREGLHCGLWQSTPGKWRIAYDEWEYCRIVEGLSVITEEGGAARIVRAGDSFVIRPGFRGTWEVLETTVKDYVVLL